MAHPSPILAERIGDEITIHPGPVTITWEFDGLVSADGHVVHCTFTARLRALSTSTEKRMLAETILGHRSCVTADDIRAHFSHPLHTTAARTIAAAPADQWLTPDDSAPSLQGALLTAANALAFTSGVELLAPFDLTIDSPSFTHARIEARHQQAADDRTRRRARIIQSVLTAGDDPENLPPLPDIADEEAHLQYLAALIDAQAMRHPRSTLLVVAGQLLLSIDLQADQVSDPRQLALPDDVGAFRSINLIRHHNSDQLLLGGRRGLLRFHPDYPADARAYLHPSLDSEMGFNDALRLGETLWATHSQAGLVGWSVEHPDQPAHCIPIETLGAPPRHLTRLDDSRAVFSAGAALYTIASDPAPRKIVDLPAAPHNIAHRDNCLFILRTDGALERRDPRSFNLLSTQPPAPDTIQSALFHCLHHPLRLLARPSGEIHLRGDTATSVRTFISGHRDLRLLRTAPANFAGLSADRNRVIIWSIRNSQPLADLHLAGIAQRRIADFTWTTITP